MNGERKYRAAREQSTITDAIRYGIYNMDFLRLGIITKVYGDGFVADVECFNDCAKNTKQQLKGVELMRAGSKDVFIHCVPKPDDIVIVIAFKDYVKEVKKEKSAMAGNVLPYSQSCMKGIVIQPTQNEDKAKLIFKIKDDEISVISKMPINIECQDTTEITAQKEVKIDCSDKLSITAKSDTAIESNGKLSLKASSGIEIDGTSEVKIKGSAGVDINNGNLKVM